MSLKNIQRWVDRLSAACEQKKWGTAVSEADCLSAEVRLVREKLWQNAEDEVQGKIIPQRHTRIAINTLKVLGIALMIVCCTTMPISIESGRAVNIASVPVQKDEEIAFVSSEEKELLSMLRAELSDQNAKTPVITADKSNTKLSNARVKDSAPAAKEDIIKPDDLITLVQIGQRSLLGGTRAIKIVN